jgi:hypothetical protein
MEIFSEEQIKRQDFVDNEIYDLVKRLVPSKRAIEWNIEMIADIRDTTQYPLQAHRAFSDRFWPHGIIRHLL